MLERFPIEIAHKIILEHSDGPWKLKDNINVACLVSKAWRNRFQPLRVPHLETPNSLALARARPSFEREQATTVLVGTPTPTEELPSRGSQETPTPTEELPSRGSQDRVMATDLHEFLALYPNARRAMLVNVRTIFYTQSDHWQGLRDFLSLCVVNVALCVRHSAPTDVYALKHLRIELVGNTILGLIALLEKFLTPEYLPHLRTLQIGLRDQGPEGRGFDFPAPSVVLLDQLEAIQVMVKETAPYRNGIPLAYAQTVTPVFFTLTSTRTSVFPPEVIPHLEYVQIDQFIADSPERLFPVMSLPNLKAIFVPHGFSFSMDPDADDDERELFADFARRKVEFVYGEPPVEWTLIDPTFQAYLRRKNSSV